MMGGAVNAMTPEQRQKWFHQMYGFYSSWKAMPRMRYHAVAIARILMHYGKPQPKGFDGLLSVLHEFPDRSYADRGKLLKHFSFNTYKEYLDSDLWAEIRSLVLARDSHRCRSCGSPATNVHHKSYDIATIVGASFSKLFSICRNCHDRVEFENHRKMSFEQAGHQTERLCGANRQDLPRHEKKFELAKRKMVGSQSGNARFTHGKHSGKRLRDIPRDYLEWYAGIPDAYNTKLQDAVKDYLISVNQTARSSGR